MASSASTPHSRPKLVATGLYQKDQKEFRYSKKKKKVLKGKRTKQSSTKKKQSPERHLNVGDHLEELRRYILAVLMVVVVLTVIAFIFSRPIHSFLIQPYKQLTDHKLLLANVYGSLEVLFKISIMSGLTIGLPICFSILWKFVTPALNSFTSYIGYVTVIASSFLFWSGLSVAWYYIFPVSLQFLFQDMLLDGVAPQTTVEKYYGFLFLLHIGCGIIFQMPLLIIILGWLGILGISWHKKKWKYIAVSMLFFSAFITPPDPISQLILACLLLGLYGTSVLAVWLIEKIKNRSSDRLNIKYD